jgi:hypothetical protein
LDQKLLVLGVVVYLLLDLKVRLEPQGPQELQELQELQEQRVLLGLLGLRERLVPLVQLN